MKTVALRGRDANDLTRTDLSTFTTTDRQTPSRFAAEGIFNPTTGKSYRDEIMAPGGSRDAAASLRAFLGREPIQEPFLKSKGLAV